MKKISREEHLAWAKERAIGYVKAGDISQAIESFFSDVGKHPETIDLQKTIFVLTWPMFRHGKLDNPQEAIDHFNKFL